MYATVKKTKVEQLIHGMLRSSNFLHGGIIHFLKQEPVLPQYIDSVLKFYSIACLHFDYQERRGIRSLLKFEINENAGVPMKLLGTIIHSFGRDAAALRVRLDELQRKLVDLGNRMLLWC